MNTEVSTAVKRLESILPLQSGLKSLSEEDALLYCKILNSYVEKGHSFKKDEFRKLASNVDISLNNLAKAKLIVLDAHGNLSGAYPFTSNEREHKVHINGVTVHCMCALDALAVSPMFGKPATIDSQCRITGEPVHLKQDGTVLKSGSLTSWFAIDWGAAVTDTVCADSLCMEMMFLANETIASEWLGKSPGTREIFDLSSAVAFAAGFFVPLVKQYQLTLQQAQVEIE